MVLKKKLHANLIGMIRTLIKEGAEQIEGDWITNYYIEAGRSASTAKHYRGQLCLSLGMKTKSKPNLHYIFDATVVLTNINAIIGVDTTVSKNEPVQAEVTAERAKELLINTATTEIYELDNQMVLIKEKREALLSKIEILKGW